MYEVGPLTDLGSRPKYPYVTAVSQTDLRKAHFPTQGRPKYNSPLHLSPSQITPFSSLERPHSVPASREKEFNRAKGEPRSPYLYT